jgi:hypothetical protein
MKKIKIILVLLIIVFSTFANTQSIKVNGIRDFIIDSKTLISVDGVIIDNNTLFEIIGHGGYKIRFRVGEDVNATISTGTLSELDFISDIKGPITNLNPLTILEQSTFITSDTNLVNLISVTDLNVGDLLEVSGSINELDNSMQLSRLELDNTISEWKLRGFARNITVPSFTIGNLTINTNAVAATNCPNGFIENVFVEIKASPDVSYASGNPLTTLTSIECQTPDVFQDPNNTIPAVVEGMVSEIIDLTSFRINDLVVFFDANTSFDNGEAEHIDVGTKLEIQGFIDTNTRFVNATTVRFIHHRVKFIGPVLPADITVGESITVFGKQISAIPQTRDDNSIISAGVVAERQVEVRGFIDSAGTIYALRVKDKGTPDNSDTKLRGDITAISQPVIEINGVTVDATSSIFEIGTGTVDITTFFSMIQIGMQLSIDNASFDNNTNILSSGKLELVEQELEDDPDDFNKSNSIPVINEIIGHGGVGLATVTRIEINELIFNSGFE